MKFVAFVAVAVVAKVNVSSGNVLFAFVLKIICIKHLCKLFKILFTCLLQLR